MHKSRIQVEIAEVYDAKTMHAILVHLRRLRCVAHIELHVRHIQPNICIIGNALANLNKNIERIRTIAALRKDAA